jgi:AcrR family transcriptional regulator
LRLLEWHRSVRNLGSITILLWLDGFDIAAGQVRKALAEGVGALVAPLLKDPSGVAGGSGIEPLAERLARMRGRALVPHTARMNLADRTRAYGVLLAALFGNEEEAAARESDTALLRRMLGADDPDEGLAYPSGLARTGSSPALPSPDELQETVEGSTDEDLDHARAAATAILRWLPLMLALVGGADDGGGPGSSDLARNLFLAEDPSLLSLLIAGLLASGGRDGDAHRGGGAAAAPPSPPVLEAPPRRGETRRAIVDAAVQVVGRNGFDGLTYREVAKLAGTTHGSVGYHFPTRDQLIHEVALQASRVAMAGTALTPPGRRLEDFAKDLAHSGEKDLYAHLFQYELALQGRRRPELVGEIRSLYDGYIKLTREALEAVGLEDPDESVVRLVLAAMEGTLLQQVVNGDPAATEEAMAELRELIAIMVEDAG